MSAPLLEIRGLSIEYPRRATSVPVLAGIDLVLEAGGCLGLVGESGAGKSQLALAVMGLLPKDARCTGELLFEGVDLARLPPAERAARRGREIALIVQDPSSSLAPHLTVGHQLADVLIAHHGLSRAAARVGARLLLERVRIAGAARRLGQYPHELSGGLRQRVLIALGLAGTPKLLIADEPTTALDVPLERELLDLFAELRRELALSLLFISHDLALVAALCDRIAVLYGGRLVEEGEVVSFYAHPRHPYSRALLAACRRLAVVSDPLLGAAQ
jgi:ABC-type dipeptide/oligopeptide/nickel transport system ATPase component